MPHPLYPFLLPPAGPDELGRLGAYRVRQLLGQGGMGLVFEAEDIELRRAVAIKVVKPTPDSEADPAQERFLREARAMAAVRNDHLVTIYQVGREGDIAYLVMELLAGETLEARLRRPGIPGVGEIIRIGRETTDGLAAVHRQGLIHRDIKPGNIWLEAPSGRVKILDFGLAREVHEREPLTMAGVVVGTPSYFSPEQARGTAVDARSDVFSLGCVFYRLCTRLLPFPGVGVAGHFGDVEDPPSVQDVNPAIPTALSDLIGRMLATDTACRPSSAAAVADELRRIKQTRTVGKERRRRIVKPAPAGRQGAKPTVAKSAGDRTRGRLAFPAFAVLLVVSLAGVGVYSRVPWSTPGTATPPAAVAKEPSPDAVIPAVPETVFLVDFKPTAAVNWPHRLFHSPDQPIVVNGKPSAHGLFFHASPPFGPPTTLTYDLGGRYRTFDAQVSLNDTVPFAWSPMTFTVTADGREIWRSTPVTYRNDAQTCSVPVAGVSTLTLQVTIPGAAGGAHGVWVEPRLTR